MKGKTLVGTGNNMGNSTTAGGALTPAEAAQQCENAAKKSGNGTPIKIRYPLGYEGNALKIPTHITDNLSTLALSPRQTP